MKHLEKYGLFENSDKTSLLNHINNSLKDWLELVQLQSVDWENVVIISPYGKELKISPEILEPIDWYQEYPGYNVGTLSSPSIDGFTYIFGASYMTPEYKDFSGAEVEKIDSCQVSDLKPAFKKIAAHNPELVGLILQDSINYDPLVVVENFKLLSKEMQEKALEQLKRFDWTEDRIKGHNLLNSFGLYDTL